MNRRTVLALTLGLGVVSAVVALLPVGPRDRQLRSSQRLQVPGAPHARKSHGRSGCALPRSVRTRRLNQAECVGRLIWFKATAGKRALSYLTFQQRIGVLIDWSACCAARARRSFRGVGLSSTIRHAASPAIPSVPPRASARPRHGLLSRRRRAAQVCRQTRLRRSACARRTPRLMRTDPHTKGGQLDQRHAACDLKFGTSTGALGFRKFPIRARSGPMAASKRRRGKPGTAFAKRSNRPGRTIGCARDQASDRASSSVPDRHHVRLLSHCLQPAQTACDPDQAAVGRTSAD